MLLVRGVNMAPCFRAFLMDRDLPAGRRASRGFRSRSSGTWPEIIGLFASYFPRDLPLTGLGLLRDSVNAASFAAITRFSVFSSQPRAL